MRELPEHVPDAVVTPTRLPSLSRSSRVGGSIKTSLLRYGTFLVLVVAWSLLSVHFRNAGRPDFLLPPPWEVLSSLREALTQGVLLAYLHGSLTHLFLAAVVGIPVGVFVGLALGVSKWTLRFFYPIFNFFQSVSGIALIPLIIIWFGFTIRGLVVAVNYAIFFPVVANTLNGVRTVPPIYGKAIRTLGASGVRLIRDVLFLGALPNILLGIRLGLTYGWRALIAAEMLFAIDGLGFMIFDARQYLNTQVIIMGMIILGVIWMFVDRMILTPVEDLTIGRWGMVRT